MTDLSAYMSLYDSDSSGADATQTHPDHTPPAPMGMAVHIAVAGRMAAPAVTLGSGSEPPAGMHAGAASGGPCLPASLPTRETAQALLPLAQAVSALPRSLPPLALGMGGGSSGSSGRPRNCRLGLQAPLPAIMIRGVDMDTDALGVDNPPVSTSTSSNRESQAPSARLADSEDDAADLDDQDDQQGAQIRGQAHTWRDHDRCMGWASAMTKMAALEEIHCPGLKFVRGSFIQQNHHVDYRFHCPYQATCHCRWKCRIRVLFGKDPKTPATAVKAESREQFHAHHCCVLQICQDFPHSSHSEPAGDKVPVLWKAFANQFEGALLLKSHEIASWLQKQAIHDQDGKILKKIVRYNQRQRAALQHPDADVAAIVKEHPGRTKGTDYALAQQYDFEQMCQSDTFGPDTAYLIPGWSIDGSDLLLDIPNPWAVHSSDDIVKHSKKGERGKCLLFTTFNDILNLYRAQQWFGADHVCLAIDHTFKVRPTQSTSPSGARLLVLFQ
jgi:hypothetical protein